MLRIGVAYAGLPAIPHRYTDRARQLAYLRSYASTQGGRCRPDGVVIARDPGPNRSQPRRRPTAGAAGFERRQPLTLVAVSVQPSFVFPARASPWTVKL